MFSVDRDRNYPRGDRDAQTEAPTSTSRLKPDSAAPELLDTAGNLISDPLLVMRSIS